MHVKALKEDEYVLLTNIRISKICDDILKVISEELNVKGKIYDIIEAYLNYNTKHFKVFEKECENQFKDYRDEDVEEKEKFIGEKLSELPIHQLIKQTKVDEIFWDFDAVTLYPSAMWDENSFYPRIETGHAFTRDMENELVEKFNTGNFTQGSAISKIKYYNPEKLIVQHIPIKEKVKKLKKIV